MSAATDHRPLDLDALGPSCDLIVAGQALGLGRTKSYELARSGEFPVRVERIGSRYRVPTAELRRFLGVSTIREDVA
ncbi:helix-turn-helix domain-containing protein [Kineococcus rhizosphaerae]|uniref:Helix-turn-helix protein n=1 Tax=Kineococcus rhizosphaerae TaxID=559628 RepID=A0A2T0R208_9ACTN|nr:helix-turn-helix domain-containing protein [Kineococcus rhizosphaerae]PRY13599.1 helix-turn-helix protein [Kineococcus rhizosphaerae]